MRQSVHVVPQHASGTQGTHACVSLCTHLHSMRQALRARAHGVSSWGEQSNTKGARTSRCDPMHLLRASTLL